MFFAVLAENDEWTDIYDFAIDEREILQKYLELKNGLPSHATAKKNSIKFLKIERIFKNLILFQQNGEYVYPLQRLMKKTMSFQKCRKL